MSVPVIDKNVGHSTAYAYAKAKGYTGTEEEYAQLMANYATVGQEAAQSAANAAQSATDAAGSASDAETAKTAAQTAKTGAETAQTGAQAAKTAAETAQGKAETAQGKAETAQTAAESAKTAAAGSATAAATSATNAGNSATAAAGSATAAATAKTGAETAQAAAETAKTGAETAAASVSASAAQIETNKQDISTLEEDFDGLRISGFSKAFRDANVTVVTGAYIDTSGNPASTSAWAYCYANVTPGEKYKVTGVAGTGGRLYLFKNSANQVIDIYPSEVNVTHVGLEITAPENAATLYVNTLVSRISVPSIQETYSNYVSSSYDGAVLCDNISGTTYKITCGTYEHTVDLAGSQNGTFSFMSLKQNGVNFKPVNDDVAPIKLQTVGYVGANHGYAWVYSCTVANHGLTVADIGKTSNDGTNTWVLIQVTDTNTIVVGCYDSSAWYKLKRVAPENLNFGGNALTVSASSMAQLYPSVKNVNVTINSDNPVKTIVTESYEIIDVGSGIEAIKTNVGSNTNTSIATRSDSLIRICNIYEFYENGSVVIYSGTKILKTGIGIEYLPLGIQSGAFSSSDSVWIPQVIGYDGVIPESGSQIDFIKSRWKVSNVPPQVYMHLNGSSSSANKSMIIGYIISDDRSDTIDNSAGFVSTAGKLYPFYVQPNTSLDSVSEFSTISFRIPQTLNAFVSIPGFGIYCGYTYVGKDIYLIVNTYLSNGNIDFPVPAFMQRKKITTVMSKDMVCQSKVSTNVISLSYTTRGSIVLKLSD